MTTAARKSPVGRARGHGSARDGARHWWMQRLTAIALVPLGIWFVASMVALAGAGQEDVAAWLSSRRSAVMMSLLVGTTFWHLYQGMQVIYDDYIHTLTVKLWAQVLTGFACIALASIGIVSILQLAIGG